MRISTEELAHSEQLMNEGKFRESLQFIDNIEKSNELTSNDRLAYQLLRSTLLYKLGLYEDALEVTEMAKEESQRLESPLQIVDALNIVSEVLLHLGRYEESLEAVEQGEQILKAVPQKRSSDWVKRKGTLLNCRGGIHLRRGQFDQALDHHKRSLSLFEEIGEKKGIAESFYGIGAIHWRNGELDQALKCFDISLRLREEIGDYFGIASSLNAVGIIYHRMGDLNKALEYHKRSLVMKEQMGNDTLVAISLNNIGVVYRRRGDMERALEYLVRSLKLREDIGNTENIALALSNIGLIYRDIGDLDTALEYHQRCLQLREEVVNNFHITNTLFNLILICTEKKLMDKARWYLERLVEIKKTDANKSIHQSYLVAEALVLKTSPRPRDKEKAKKLLSKVIGAEIVEEDVIMIAMINFYELVLADLKVSGNQQEFDEVRTLVSRLVERAREQQSYAVLTETYILRSKLALLELNLMEARRFLTQAQAIAEDKGLRRLTMLISREHDIILDELSKWEELIEKGASLVERAVLVDVQSTVVDIIRKRVAIQSELPNDEPVHIAILKQDEGLTIFSKSFLSVQIDDFSSKIEKTCDVLSSQFLNRAKISEYTLLMQSNVPLRVCYVFKGQSYSAQQKLTQFNNSISTNRSLFAILYRVTRQKSTLKKNDKAIIDNMINTIFS